MEKGFKKKRWAGVWGLEEVVHGDPRLPAQWFSLWENMSGFNSLKEVWKTSLVNLNILRDLILTKQVIWWPVSYFEP